MFLSSGKICASQQAVKVKITEFSKEKCNELVDAMIQTAEPHYVDKFTGEIKSSSQYSVSSPDMEHYFTNMTLRHCLEMSSRLKNNSLNSVK